MDHSSRKRASNYFQSNEIQTSKIKVAQFDVSNVDLISFEKDNINSESDVSQERRNTTFVSLEADQDLSNDPLELYSGLQDYVQVHINNDKDNSESDAEGSEQCTEQESIDPKELEDIEKIKQWVIEYKIPHKHVNKLLKILKARLLPSIPSSTETLLKINEPGQINSPVIDASNVQCKSNFETFVITQLMSQHSYMQRIENKLDNFANIFLAKKECLPQKYDIDFKSKYNLSFPINDKHLFTLFDERLRSDKFLQHDVCLELNNCLDKDYSISKSILTMLRAFITKNVAMQYTASRHSKENAKDIFKSTQFYECMEGVILAARNTTSLPNCTNTELISSLSDVLSNAKKWNERNK